MNTHTAKPGDLLRSTQTGGLFRVERIAPAGTAGTSHAAGPTVYAQMVMMGGALSDYRVAIQNGSISYPPSNFESVES